MKYFQVVIVFVVASLLAACSSFDELADSTTSQGASDDTAVAADNSSDEGELNGNTNGVSSVDSYIQARQEAIDVFSNSVGQHPDELGEQGLLGIYSSSVIQEDAELTGFNLSLSSNSSGSAFSTQAIYSYTTSVSVDEASEQVLEGLEAFVGDGAEVTNTIDGSGEISINANYVDSSPRKSVRITSRNDQTLVVVQSNEDGERPASEPSFVNEGPLPVGGSLRIWSVLEGEVANFFFENGSVQPLTIQVLREYDLPLEDLDQELDSSIDEFGLERDLELGEVSGNGLSFETLETELIGSSDNPIVAAEYIDRIES